MTVDEISMPKATLKVGIVSGNTSNHSLPECILLT